MTDRIRNGRGHRAYRRQQRGLKAYLQRQGITHCPTCGAAFDFDNPNGKHAYTADHPKAIANGGSLTGQRLVPMCRSCNARKRDTVIPTIRPAS